MSNNIHKRCAEIMAELGKNGEFEFWEEFKWLPKQKLEKRLKDILENDVDEKYYLSDKMIKGFTESLGDGKVGFINQDTQASQVISSDGLSNTLCAGTHGYAQGYIKEPNCTPIGLLDIKGNDLIRRVYDTKGLSQCLTTMESGNRQPKIQIDNPLKGKTKYGWHFEQNVYSKNSICTRTIMAGEGSGSRAKVIEEPIPLQLGNTKSRGEHIGKSGDSAFCLRASQCNGIIQDDYRIRKLTPRECFRLQDFDDTFKFVVSNSQLYKQAGNSISVNVSEMIFRQIEFSKGENMNKNSLF